MNRRRMLAGALASLVATSGWAVVRGERDRDIWVFKGIRYGADTKPNRFMPPRPPEDGRGDEPNRYGPASPQPRPDEPVSEDCLFLNVWTPSTTEGRRPVMVYIHGGGYARGSGSSPQYDGVAVAMSWWSR
jgi:para-nitrobenzyl esterase